MSVVIAAPGTAQPDVAAQLQAPPHLWLREQSGQPGSQSGPRYEGCGPPSPPSQPADHPAPHCTSVLLEPLRRRQEGRKHKDFWCDLFSLFGNFWGFFFFLCRILPSMRTIRMSLMMVKVVNKTNTENRKVQIGSAILYSG